MLATCCDLAGLLRGKVWMRSMSGGRWLMCNQARKVTQCAWQYAWQLVCRELPSTLCAWRPGYTEMMLPAVRCRNAMRGATPFKHVKSNNHQVAMSAGTCSSGIYG